MDPTEGFQQVIRSRRLAAGLTQAQLADLLKITSATVSRWETRGPPPARRNRAALAHELGGKPGDYA